MESTLDLISMFILGAAGTGHCVGMCGPLVLALPSRVGRARAHIFYHLGRVTTYSLVGAVLGGAGVLVRTVGRSVGSAPEPLARVQVAFSIVAALVLAAFALVRLGIAGEPRWMALATPARLPGFRRVQRSAFRVGGSGALLLFGLLLGFLPCGLSYAAFARALPAGGPLEGAMLLLAFGVGTLPGLLLVGGLGSRLAQAHAASFNVISGILMLGMAASLTVDAIAAWT